MVALLLTSGSADAACVSQPHGEIERFQLKIPALVEAWLEETWGDQLDDENRWSELIAAVEMLRDVFPSGGPPLSFQYIYWPQESVEQWVPGRSEEAIAAVEEALERLERDGFFERMKALTSARRVLAPVQPPLIIERGGVERNPHSRLVLKRKAARALEARLHLDAKAGDYDSAIARLEAILALARLCGHHPLWRGYEVSGQIVSQGFQRAIEDLFAPGMEEHHYRTILQALDRQPFSGQLTLALEAERIAAYQLVEHVHRTGRLPEVLKGPALPDARGDDNLRDRQIAFAQAYYQRLIRSSGMPAWEMLPVFDDLNIAPRQYEALHALLYNSNVRQETHLLVHTCIDGLRLMCALELMRIDTGAYPEMLDELVPDYLEQLPPDPFTGEPFRYRLFEKGEDPFGRDYLLYSLGYDRIDHGGRADRWGRFPINGWRTGTDFVINRVRGDSAESGRAESVSLVDPLPKAVTRYNTRIPALVEDYLEEHWGSELEAENAWPMLIETVEMVRDAFPADSRSTFDVFVLTDDALAQRFPDGGIDEARREATEALGRLKRAGFFDRAAALAHARRFVPPAPDGLIIDAEFPAPGQATRLSLVHTSIRALGAKIHLRAEAGKYDEAVVLFESMLALARAAAHYPDSFSYANGAHMSGDACWRVHRALLTRDLEPQHYRAIAAAMSRQQAGDLLTLAFQGDCIAALQGIEHAFETGYLPPMARAVFRRDLIGNEDFRDDQFAIIRQHRQQLTAASRLPAWEAFAALEAMEFKMESHTPPAMRLFEHLRSVARMRPRQDAIIDGTRIIVALEWMRTETGSYPESLEELVPMYIDALPPDPYTGKAFRYRRFEEGQDPHGRGYLLYSLGYDRTDNGGRAHDRWMHFGSSPNSAGFDFIINDHRWSFRKHW